MPRSFSISIQSETVDLRPALPCTAPASWMTWACSASASVRVDLPASGWAMTAKVRRRVASAARSEEHTSELQSRFDLVCRLLLEKKYFSIVVCRRLRLSSYQIYIITHQKSRFCYKE